MKIVILDKKYFLSDLPVNGFEWEEYEDTTKDEIVARLYDADIALTNVVPFDRETLKQLPKLKMIYLNCTGYEKIDVDACREFGITVCNINDWCTNSVVEHILSLMFSLNRSLPSYHQFVKEGNWKATSYELAYTPPKEIRGSVLGIVGYGTLGKQLSKVSKALGMNILIAERKNSTNIREGYTSFDEVLKQSDFISIQTPLNEQTYHTISYREFEKMKSDAVLINCGRGGLVDEKALLDALENNKIGGAGLDFLEAESFEDGKLFNYAGHNLILTSHIAFASQQSITNNTEMIMENIRQFINGTPINKVN